MKIYRSLFLVMVGLSFLPSLATDKDLCRITSNGIALSDIILSKNSNAKIESFVENPTLIGLHSVVQSIFPKKNTELALFSTEKEVVLSISFFPNLGFNMKAFDPSSFIPNLGIRRLGGHYARIARFNIPSERDQKYRDDTHIHKASWDGDHLIVTLRRGKVGKLYDDRGGKSKAVHRLKLSFENDRLFEITLDNYNLLGIKDFAEIPFSKETMSITCLNE